MATLDLLAQQIEAILLIENQHRTVESLAEQLDVDLERVEASAQQLAEHYRAHHHGIEIVTSARGILLLPEKSVWEAIAPHYRSLQTEPLPNPAVETLAIVAYSQPITATEIERLRGVRPDHALRLLLEQKLIEVTGTKKAPGLPRLYGTTPQFLQLYNLQRLTDLPELAEEDAIRFLSSR